jgi:hypothetical protein
VDFRQRQNAIPDFAQDNTATAGTDIDGNDFLRHFHACSLVRFQQLSPVDGHGALKMQT